MPKQTIAIASDHAGVELKKMLKQDIEKLGYPVVDLGPNTTQSVDYPDFAHQLADWMKPKPESIGILICGSGIGMSIAANRHSHIRAALVCNPEQAVLSRQHNNANVLCLGARQMSADIAKEAVKTFLSTAFEGGRHENRVRKINT
jgi:ribose 5-phosphate isomerase B